MKLDNKNWTLEEALIKLGTPKKNVSDEEKQNEKKPDEKKKNKRVFPKIPYGGLGTHREHPLVLKFGGYADKGII